MAVTLIYNTDEKGPLSDNILAVVLPSFKVLTKESDSDIPEYLDSFPNRWKANESGYRERIVETSEDFFVDNTDSIDLVAPEVNEDEMPLSAFYWEILRVYNSQVLSSGIFSDDEARELLQEGGWFND